HAGAWNESHTIKIFFVSIASKPPSVNHETSRTKPRGARWSPRDRSSGSPDEALRRADARRAAGPQRDHVDGGAAEESHRQPGPPQAAAHVQAHAGVDVEPAVHVFGRPVRHPEGAEDGQAHLTAVRMTREDQV